MKKFLARFLYFSGFAVMAYMILVIIWGMTMPLYLRKNLNFMLGSYGHMHTRIRDISNTGQVDVLILGSSHAYRGFDTRIFKDYGIKAFNLGSSSQSLVESELLLEKYIDKLRPEIVILEVFPGSFSSDGVESSLDLLSNGEIDWGMIKMTAELKHIKALNTLIYSGFRQITGLDKNFSEPVRRDEDFYITGGGYVEREISYYSPVAQPPVTWEFTDLQTGSFHNILAMMRQKNVKVLLVQAPVTKTLYSSWTNTREIDDYFNGIGNYINLNGTVNLDDSLHFYDEHHLNQDGVRIMNKKFIELSGITDYFKSSPVTIR